MNERLESIGAANDGCGATQARLRGLNGAAGRKPRLVGDTGVIAMLKMQKAASIAAGAMVVLVALNPAPVRADTESAGGAWAGLDLGAAQVQRRAGSLRDDRGRFYMGLAGGWVVHERLLLGAELSGWLVQAGNLNDPSRGAGISRVFAVARWYPGARSGLFVHVGAGSLTGWDNAPGAPRRRGSGWELGGGQALGPSPLGGTIVPFLRLGGGKAGNLKVQAVTLGLGLTWH